MGLRANWLVPLLLPSNSAVSMDADINISIAIIGGYHWSNSAGFLKPSRPIADEYSAALPPEIWIVP